MKGGRESLTHSQAVTVMSISFESAAAGGDICYSVSICLSVCTWAGDHHQHRDQSGARAKEANECK